jgi:integrase
MPGERLRGHTAQHGARRRRRRLDAGESIKALSEYLGHHDPGFTLRTYTHLMPTSTARTQRAIDGLFGDRLEQGIDGPNTAQDEESGL